MKTITLLLAALTMAAGLSAATPAAASWDGHGSHWRRHHRHDHHWRRHHGEHHWRHRYHHYGYGYGYVPPPRVVYAPRAYYYYSPSYW